MSQLVVWSLDSQRYALPLSVVERVALTPLPDAPTVIRGVIDMHAQLIPVVDMRLRLPPREVALTDLLMLAYGARRAIAFFVDAVSGVIDRPLDTLAADALAAGDGCIAGLARLPDGIVLIQNLDRLLSLDEERALDVALAGKAPQ
jgi:purine-binding chemotaxis protein CheW